MQIFSLHPPGGMSRCYAYHSWPAAQPDETKKKQQANWSRRLMLLRPAGFLLLKVTHTVQTKDIFSLNMNITFIHSNVFSGASNHSHSGITVSRPDSLCQSTLWARARMIPTAFSGVAILSNVHPHTVIPSSTAGLQLSTQPTL